MALSRTAIYVALVTDTRTPAPHNLSQHEDPWDNACNFAGGENYACVFGYLLRCLKLPTMTPDRMQGTFDGILTSLLEYGLSFQR